MTIETLISQNQSGDEGHYRGPWLADTAAVLAVALDRVLGADQDHADADAFAERLALAQAGCFD